MKKIKVFLLYTSIPLLLLCAMLSCTTTNVIREDPDRYWDLSSLTQSPAYENVDFPESEYPGLSAVFFEGVPFQGKPTKVFAYIGIPDGPVPEGGFPGVVLLHGRGGTALGWAAELWQSYGYAVIAIDWYNQRPVSVNGDCAIPLEGGKRQDHLGTVSNAILAHSLLRSLPEVNPAKTACVGLSWGSWYASTIAAVDSRFRCIINIYCGDIKDNQTKPEDALVDGRFLHAAKVPMYWIASTDDRWATPRTLQTAFDESATLWNKSVFNKIPHGHDGFKFPVCRRVADCFLKSGTELPKLGKNKYRDGVLSAPLLTEGKGVKKAFLCYTCDRGHADQPFLREWKLLEVPVENGKVSAKLPDHTFQCLFAVFDELPECDYCCGSGDLFECPPDDQKN